MGYSIRDVLGRAKELRKDPRSRYGLCRTLDLWGLPEQLVENIFSSWEHYTGCIEYPVPSPYFPVDDVVEAARQSYEAARDMYEGEYGALRIKLLDHLISYLEGYLKDHG